MVDGGIYRIVSDCRDTPDQRAGAVGPRVSGAVKSCVYISASRHAEQKEKAHLKHRVAVFRSRAAERYHNR